MNLEGIYPALSNDEYHSSPAISRSGIKLFNDSPMHYWANYLNPNRPKKNYTDAMRFGSAFHMYILENHLFNDHFTVEPERVLLKNVGRKAYEEYKAELAEIENTKKEILSFHEMQTILDMTESLQQNETAWYLIQDATYEQSYFWRDKDTGLMLKARPDILHENIIVDLKTCASADYKTFQRAMCNEMYHVQGAMIREGILHFTGKDIPHVINVCIEKSYPHAIGIKIISEDALNEGKKLFKSILSEMKECFAKDKWPSYQIEDVALPAWF